MGRGDGAGWLGESGNRLWAALRYGSRPGVFWGKGRSGVGL